MLTAGKPKRARMVAVALAVFVSFMHLFAWSMLKGALAFGADLDRKTFVAVTASLALSFSLMLSQAMESVTRAFYSRSDLELILSSPVNTRRLFAVRIGALAVSTALLGLALSAPFINVAALLGGPRWLAAYGVIAAMGLVAAALAVALTVALFRTIGPKRTRLIAQIVAAVIGAAFVIGLQVAAIMSSGTISRAALIESGDFLRHAPEIESIFWWPARAALGDGQVLAIVFGAGLLTLAAAIVAFSTRFGEHVVAASGVVFARGRESELAAAFRGGSPLQALRRKEWTLLRRDPWLVSQTLMQLLYLAPPALLLWKSFSGGETALVLLIPVLVMAAGQLAGGLAWLAISGEDAPDLVATAPVPRHAVVRAKVEAVMGLIALVFAPFVLVLAVAEPAFAAIAAAGVAVATGSSAAIQIWFRSQARRSQFRRRQTSSRLATFAEAFTSITWAATAALAAAGTWLAVMTGAIALMLLAGTRLLAPRAA